MHSQVEACSLHFPLTAPLESESVFKELKFEISTQYASIWWHSTLAYLLCDAGLVTMPI